MADRIEAAGGVVWRRKKGEVQLLLVHRPRYDDWSFPKGKLDDGEKPLDAGLREVEEETGLHCTAGTKLSSVRYRDRKGRDKRVRYWVMSVDGGSFAPNDEVDEIEWCSPDDARHRLSYEHDIALVDEFEALDLG